MSRISTVFLLTCAAIGVAGGIMLTAANWVSTVLFAAAPFAAVALAGLWLVPAAVAMRLLERPGSALLVGLISGLVAAPLSGYGWGSVATNLWWAFFVELPFLVVLYRFFHRWQFFAGAVVVAAVYPTLAWASFGLDAFAPLTVVLFYLLTLVASAAGMAIGIAVADALRRAGVARLARRRPRTSAT